MANKKSIAKRSFKPTLHKPAKLMLFRGDGAKYVGDFEPTWPDASEQSEWSKDKYEIEMSKALNWYNHTQDDDDGHKKALHALSLSGHFPELIKTLKDSTLDIPQTAAWLIRMAEVGLVLRFHEKRFIVKALHKCMDSAKAASTEKANKPNIQEYISAKLKKVMGEIDGKFDDFINANYQYARKQNTSIMDVLTSPETSAPSNRTKDLIEYATKYLSEYNAVLAGKDKQIVEAYTHLGKRELKAAIAWWEQAITDINTFGSQKKSTRKARKKKAVPPAKIVGKLKFLKTYPALNLTSIDPTQIIKSSYLLTFDTKTRKICQYVALPDSTLEVKGTKIINFDTIKSGMKILRKPTEQLKRLEMLSKPGAVKWFKDITAVQVKAKPAITATSILLRISK